MNKYQNFKKYYLISFLIGVLLFDALILITRITFNATFYIAFSFVNVSFILSILITLFSKDGVTGEKGIYPTHMVGWLLVALSLITAIILFVLPFDNKLGAVIPFIVIFAVCGILFTLASINGNVIRRENDAKLILVRMKDVPGALKTIEDMATNPTIKDMVVELYELAVKAVKEGNDCYVDKSIMDHVRFIYKNIKRDEMDNIYSNLQQTKKLFLERK